MIYCFDSIAHENCFVNHEPIIYNNYSCMLIKIRRLYLTFVRENCILLLTKSCLISRNQQLLISEFISIAPFLRLPKTHELKFFLSAAKEKFLTLEHLGGLGGVGGGGFGAVPHQSLKHVIELSNLKQAIN